MNRFDLRALLAALLIMLPCSLVRADDDPGTITVDLDVDFSLTDSVGMDFVEIFFNLDGDVDFIDVDLDFESTQSSTWAGDVTMALIDPNGNAIEWGGYDHWFGYLENPPNYDASWNTNTTGKYTFSFDFSSYGLNGSGQWTLKVMNGYATSTDGNWVGFVSLSTCPDCLESDCNQNEIEDADDIANGSSEDCDGNGLPDECQSDCNDNGITDACEDAEDCDGNGVPDECEPDCNGNGVTDACESEGDCDANGIPDACEPDCDFDGITDACEPDDDENGLPNDCEPTIGEPIAFDFQGAGLQSEVISFIHNGPVNQLVVDMDFTTEHPFTWAGDLKFVVSSPTGLSFFFGGDNPGGMFPSLGDFPSSMNNSLSQSNTHTFTMPGPTDGGSGLWTIQLINDYSGSNGGHWKGTIDMGQCGNCYLDCNGNGLPDHHEINNGIVDDCNQNGVPDSCDLAEGNDLNNDDVIDSCQINCGTEFNFDFNGRASDVLEIPFNLDGGLIEVSIGTVFQNTMQNQAWAGDLLIALVNPDGVGIEVGGYDNTLGYANAGNFPVSWNRHLSGNYGRHVFTVSNQQLIGSGEWTLKVSNGWMSSTGARWTGIVNICSLSAPQADDEPEVGDNGNNDEENGSTINDCDGNGLDDEAEILSDPSLDCDGNDRVDACDLILGAEDTNENLILDSCEIAAGDFNLDGCVDGQDLGLFLLMYGMVDPEYGDLNGDGEVDGADYGLMLLLMQNNCP
jgi:hypothetical protein